MSALRDPPKSKIKCVWTFPITVAHTDTEQTFITMITSTTTSITIIITLPFINVYI
jgi:hypothetical protein